MNDWGRRLVLDVGFDHVVSMASEELQREGFEVLGRLDVREGIRRTLDEDFRRYTIVSVWHPALALQALRRSLDVGVELPLNIAIYELADQETALTVPDPLPSLSADRTWREECPELVAIEIQLSECLGHALGRMSRMARAVAVPAQ